MDAMEEDGNVVTNHQDLSVPSKRRWERIKFGSFEYEGEILDGKACGFGRMHSDAPKVSYHGFFQDQQFHGAGLYFFENGDRFEGFFANHKPVGEGIFTYGNRRLRVHYDGWRVLGEGAEPQVLGDAHDEQITEEVHIPVLAMSKCSSLASMGHEDYSHCRLVNARLALAAPIRAEHPLINPAEIAGSIAVVLRGGCSLAAKVDHCQRAGAAAVLILGSDNEPLPPLALSVINPGRKIH
jgi:hypothetical protein